MVVPLRSVLDQGSFQEVKTPLVPTTELEPQPVFISTSKASTAVVRLALHLPVLPWPAVTAEVMARASCIPTSISLSTMVCDYG